MIRVTTADQDDWPALSEVLADAFHDDPVLGWLLPDTATRQAALRRFFAVETRDIVLQHGWTQMAVAPGTTAGAALVLPPGTWRTPVGVLARHALDIAAVFGRRLPRALGVLNRMEHLHPREPHVYLPYIGVAPAAQGAGHGTAMLAPILARCDEAGLPAYLEASSADSARLYERLGFVTSQTITPLGSPPLALMTRSPQRLR